MPDKWKSVEEVHNHAQKAVGKQIKNLVKKETYLNFNPNNKGWIGNSIESDWFGIKNNSNKEADFPHLNLELKVTPIRKTKTGWSAKERLVLNIFDFNDEYKRDFETASFIEKANLMELMYYEYKQDTPSPDLYIKAATLFSLHDLPEEDKLIIQQDWEIIVNKIKDGKAEELSDRLTTYLGATTKGSKSEKNMTTQPFSEEKAHRRSFTLKGSYMTVLARKIMSDDFIEPIYRTSTEQDLSMVAESALDYTEPEHIIKDVSLLKNKTFEEIIIGHFKPFIGRTKVDLANAFNVKIKKANDKSSTAILARKMLNIDTDIESTDEFIKSGMKVKTIVIDAKQRKYESAKRKTTEPSKIHRYFEFNDVIKTTWDDSDLYEYLSATKYLFVIFEQNETSLIFRGVKFWSIPEEDLIGLVKDTWQKTIDIINRGVSLTYHPVNTKKGYEVKNNFPAMSDDTIIHVRPDARYASYKDSSNSFPLPVAANWSNRPYDKMEELTNFYMTKQAFWFNPSYMYQQVKDIFECDN